MLLEQVNSGDILLFLAVVEGGSFVAGGKALGLTGSAASKAVGRLEAHLDARLFQRSSHAIHLTDEGRTFLDKAEAVRRAIDDAEASLGSAAGVPRGLLRLSVPDALGRRVVLPIVARYFERWPEVRLELSFTDRVVDVVEEGFELVLPIGQVRAPPGMICKIVASLPASLVASPAYLERRGHPPHVEALTTHECLLFRANARAQPWMFPGEDGQLQRVSVSGRVRADSGEALRQAALLGLGIAFLPDLVVHEDVEAGRLQRVLPDVATGEARLTALYPTRRQLEPRVRQFIDMLAGAFG